MHQPCHYTYYHEKQQGLLWRNCKLSVLTLEPNPYFYDALLQCHFYNDIINSLAPLDDLSEQEYWFFIIALRHSHQDYSKELQKMQIRYPYNPLIQKLKYPYPIFKLGPPFSTTKAFFKAKYTQSMLSMENHHYLNLPNSLVFLVSTKWLQQFFSQREECPPIDNRTIVTPAKYLDIVDTNYNFVVKSSSKLDQDFKVAVPEVFFNLYQKYGGIMVPRLTPFERYSGKIETHYITIKPLIVESRCIYSLQFQMQISKESFVDQIIKRAKRLIINYGIVPQSKRNHNWEIILAPDLTRNQLINQLQSETQIKSDKLIRALGNTTAEFSYLLKPEISLAINIYSTYNYLKNVSNIKPTESKRKKCLTCNSYDNLIPCSCNKVYFCNSICLQKHNQHRKVCDNITKQVGKLDKLLQHYHTKQSSLLYSQYRQLGKVGLQNINNSCYMNSALQCLLRIDSLNQHLLQNKFVPNINVSNPLGSGGQLICAYAQLVKQYFTTTAKFISPDRLFRLISQNKHFKAGIHQDAQQFLNFFLDKLHEDLNIIKDKRCVEKVEGEGMEDNKISEQSWNNYKLRDDSFIVDIMSGQYRSKIQCPDCKKISVTCDPFLTITLQFPLPVKYEEVQGYYVTLDGEFKKVDIKVPSNMKTKQFFELTFGGQISAVYQINKKIITEWLPERQVSANINKAGVSFFYSKPAGCQVQLNIDILTSSEISDSYIRRIYTPSIIDQANLKYQIAAHLRYPLCTALDRKFDTTESFLQYIISRDVINIVKFSTPHFFPLKPPQSYTITIRINRSQAQFKNQLKLNHQAGKHTAYTPIPIVNSNTKMNIINMLQHFKLTQQLTEDNSWYCNRCKQHKLAFKSIKIFKYPKYLIVHLKRFNHRGKYAIYGQKVFTKVELQQREIIQGNQYELIGVVNHFGGLSTGHYTAYVKRQDNWYLYDDSRVTRAQMNGDNAYLLFYEMKRAKEIMQDESAEKESMQNGEKRQEDQREEEGQWEQTQGENSSMSWLLGLQNKSKQLH